MWSSESNVAKLTSPSNYRSQFLRVVRGLLSTASKLASTWNCSVAHELPHWWDRKILLLEGRYNPPRSNSKLLNLSLFQCGTDMLRSHLLPATNRYNP
ncbi:hypothetical protein TNCV_3213081 [Trichonephila clavipes]|nr:hypothetical protein TNCV_3213081 [Trichonephila clavipes]